MSKQVCGQDELAAEALLLHLLSRMYARQAS